MKYKHGTFFLKIFIIFDIISNNITIFSRQFNSGSSKRNGARFRTQGGTTTGVNATIVAENTEFLTSDEQESVKNYLANAKNLGQREKDLLKREEEKKKENINKKENEIKECVRSIKEIKDLVINLRFEKEDIEKIKSKIKGLEEIIKGQIYKAQEYIEDEYRTDKVKNDDILNKIKNEIINKFTKHKEDFDKYIKNINNILASVSNFIASIQKFEDTKKLEDSINDCLNNVEFDGYHDILSNFNNYFSELENMNVKCNKFKMSNFYKSLDKAQLKLSEIDSQYKKFIDGFIGKTVLKKDELNNFFDSFKKDNDKANKDFDDLLKNQRLDGAKTQQDIKNAFAKKDKTIEVFCKDIRTKNEDFKSKFEENKKKNDEKNKEFEIFNQLKKAILNSKSKYELSDIKGHFEDNENIKNKINEYIKECKGYDEKMKEQIKKYEAIKKNKEELISKYSEDCKYAYNVKSEKLVDFDETEEEAKNVEEILKSVKKKKELLNNANFVLSQDEQNELTKAITASEKYIKDYLDEKTKETNKHKADINTLEKNIKDDEFKLKNNIAQYNAILAQKVEKRQQYLERIKNIYDEIKKKIDKIEYDDEIKNNIFDNLKGKFTNNFNNEFKNVTFGNTTDYLQTENYDLLKKLKQLLKGDFVQDKYFTDNFKLNNKKELNDFIDEKQKEIEEIQKKQKKIIEEITNITSKINKLEENKKAFEKTQKDYKNKCEKFEKVIKDNESLFKEFGDAIKNKCEDLLKKCSDNKESINNIKFNYDTIINSKSKVDNKDKKIEAGGSVLNYANYKIEPYNANIYKDYTKDKSNLFDYYYSINSVKFINNALDKNEIIQKQQSIIPLCHKLMEKINNFIKAYNGIGTVEKGFIKIEENRKYYERHKEFLKDRQYVSNYSLYFLEYFGCKKDYEKIQEDIVGLYNVLLEYKALLKVENDKKIDDKIGKNIKIVNDLLSPYYKNLFEDISGGSINFKVEIKKGGAGTYLNKIVEKLKEGTFKDYFGRLCTQYNVDEININTGSIRWGIEFLKKININEYGAIDNSKKGLIEFKTAKMYKNISKIKKEFISFISESKIGKNLNEAEFKCYKKIDLLRGNNYLASDLKILNDKLSEIASELMRFENINNLNKDVVDLSKINIDEKDSLRKIYYVFKFTTYFDKIFDKENGVLKDVIDKIKEKLMEIYSKEIIEQLGILKKSVEDGDAAKGEVDGVLCKVFGKDITNNADKFFLQEVQKTMEKKYIVVTPDKKTVYKSKLKTNTEDLVEIYKKIEGEFNNEFQILKNIKIDKVDSLDNFKGVIQRVINLRDELYTILSKFNKLCKDDPDIYNVDKDFFNYEVKNKKLELKYVIEPNNENDDSKKLIKYLITGLDADQNANQNANQDIKLSDIFGSVDTILLNFYRDIEELNRQIKIIEYINTDSTNKVLKTLYELTELDVKFGKKSDKNFEEFKEDDFLDTNNLVNKYKDIFPTKQIEELRNSEGFKTFLTKKKKDKDDVEFYIHHLIRKKVAEILNDLYDKIILNVFCSNKFFNPDVFSPDNGKTYKDGFNFLTNYVYFFKEYFAFHTAFTNLLKGFEFIKEENNVFGGSDTKLSFFNILNQNIANINTLLKIHGFDLKGDTVEICNKKPNNNKKNIYTTKGILGKICNIVIEEIVKLNLGDVKVLNQKMLNNIYENIKVKKNVNIDGEMNVDINDSITFIENFKKSINYAELSKDKNNKHKLYDNSNFEFTKLLDPRVKDLLDNIVCNEKSSVNKFVEHFGNLGSSKKYIIKDIKNKDFIYQVKRTICSELDKKCNPNDDPVKSQQSRLYYFAKDCTLYKLLLDIFENIFTKLICKFQNGNNREKMIALNYIKFPIGILEKLINNEHGYTNDMCYNELKSYRDNYLIIFGLDIIENENTYEEDGVEKTNVFYFDFYEDLELIFDGNDVGNKISKMVNNIRFYKLVYNYQYSNESYSLRAVFDEDDLKYINNNNIRKAIVDYSNALFSKGDDPKQKITGILNSTIKKQVEFDNDTIQLLNDDPEEDKEDKEKNVGDKNIMERIYKKMIRRYETYQKELGELDTETDDKEEQKKIEDLKNKVFREINALYNKVKIV